MAAHAAGFGTGGKRNHTQSRSVRVSAKRAKFRSAGRAASRRKGRIAAIRAVSAVDVDLVTAPPEPPGPEADGMPFHLSDRDKAVFAVRKGQQRRTSSELAQTTGVHALAYVIRYLPGGRNSFLELCKMSMLNGDVAAKAFWDVYDGLSKTQQKLIPLDDVLTASNVKLSELMAGIVGHGIEAATDMGNLIAAMFHPQVVAKMGESALRTTGPHAEIAAEDRKLLLQGRGAIPTPRGASIHLHANANANSNANAAAASAAEPSVPTFADDMAALTGTRPGRLLPAESVIDAEPLLGAIEPAKVSR